MLSLKIEYMCLHSRIFKGVISFTQILETIYNVSNYCILINIYIWASVPMGLMIIIEYGIGFTIKMNKNL